MRTWSFLLACTTLWANGGADAATFRVAAAMDVPVPGTVVFIGYGSEADGTPDPRRRFLYQPLVRSADHFFVKFSRLFRM